MKKIPAPAATGDVRRYATESEPTRGLVFFLHGFGLHAEKFEPLYAIINELGYDVVAHDLLGHGRWRQTKLTASMADEIVAHSLTVYRAFAQERPLLMGVGLFGGFLMQRIMAATTGDDWKPPSVLYSVDPAPLPLGMLSAIARRPRLLEQLDRLHFGYDHRRLTHDADADAVFVEDDAVCWRRFPLGLSLLASQAINRFYAEPDLGFATRHAIVYGTDNQLAPIAKVRSYAADSPSRFRIYEVEGGAFHLHRDRDDVRARFQAQLAAALAHVKDQAPVAHRPPAIAGGGALGTVRRLHDLMFDPIGTIDRAIAEHGSCFTLPIPFGIRPPFTFVTTREGYRRVLDLPASVGRNGPIIDRVPALAKWAPRSDGSPEHLQALLLTGRRFIGRQLRQRTSSQLRNEVAARTRDVVARWGERIEVSQAVVELVHETSSRLLLGDDLWDALGPDALRDVRRVANAVDAARATLALSPAARLLPEYRATKRLGHRMLELARGQGPGTFLQGVRELRMRERPLPAEDVAWMMFFAVWNATLYTGTYGVWAYLDLLSHPRALAHARGLTDQREAYLTAGVTETMRLNPISWQLRSLASDVVVEADGQRFEVPAGHFLSVFSHRLNRDPEAYPDPETWDPSRHLEAATAPLLFGTGPFSCVAQRWVKVLITTILSTLIDELEVNLEGPLPTRRSRVHLLYPDRAIPAAARARGSAAKVQMGRKDR